MNSPALKTDESGNSGRPRVETLLLALILSFGIVVAGTLIAWYAFQAVSRQREVARQASSEARLGFVAFLVQDYAITTGTLPDTVIRSHSNLQSSWRLHVGRRVVGSPVGQYDFTSPWSSPQNQAVANDLSSTFQKPGESSTPFTLVKMSKEQVNSVFPSFAPKVNQTCVAVAMIPNLQPPLSWTEPRDISIGELKAYIKRDRVIAIALVSDITEHHPMLLSGDMTKLAHIDESP